MSRVLKFLLHQYSVVSYSTLSPSDTFLAATTSPPGSRRPVLCKSLCFFNWPLLFNFNPGHFSHLKSKFIITISHPFSPFDHWPLTWNRRTDILAAIFRARPGPARVIAHAHNSVRQLPLQPRGRHTQSCAAMVPSGNVKLESEPKG